MSKSASGNGTIRKVTRMKNGKSYPYWEARYTVGYSPSTGKQIQRSIYGKTQKEVAQKLKEVTASVDKGLYVEPAKMTVKQWCEQWVDTYTTNIKERSRIEYRAKINTYIIPSIGAIPLRSLTTAKIQGMYNSLAEKLSPKTVKDIHGIVHKCLEQAYINKMITFNPSTGCTLPRIEKKSHICPMEEGQITAFREAIKGDPLESVYTFALFTGLREGEILGLKWDCIEGNIVTVDKQLQLVSGEYKLVTTKNSKPRRIAIAPSIVALLKHERVKQLENKLKYGELYNDSGFVFQNELGEHISRSRLYQRFKKIVASIGCPDLRFHDLRHTFAVMSLKAGTDIKTISESLGHSNISITMDIYAHVTEAMKLASAEKLERLFNAI